MWSTFVADHALTVAIVDVTHGLMRADLTRSAFLVENVAASDFQQGSITFANVNSDQNNKVT
jgi:S-adenosylmethionine hydrolase